MLKCFSTFKFLSIFVFLIAFLTLLSFHVGETNPHVFEVFANADTRKDFDGNNTTIFAKSNVWAENITQFAVDENGNAVGSAGWFRVRGFIDGEGYNEGWDYVANANSPFDWGYADSTLKEVKGKGCHASYYASASITNQADFDYAFDNDDVEANPEP